MISEKDESGFPITAVICLLAVVGIIALGALL